MKELILERVITVTGLQKPITSYNQNNTSCSVNKCDIFPYIEKAILQLQVPPIHTLALWSDRQFSESL